MGTLTINRFFGLHVWLMPALLVLLAVGHLVIFRHNGSAGPPLDTDLKKLPQGRFWPNQLFMDAFASFLVFIVMIVLSIVVPPPLDQKADPTQTFIAYPAWYFLALYGMLRIAGGAPDSVVTIANLLATVVIPGGLVTLLILLPWIDRNPSRSLRRRPWILGLTAISVVVAVGLSVYSQLAIMKEQADAGQTKPAATAAAPASSGNASQNGTKIFAANCASCHGAAGQGTPNVFPPLAGNPDVTGDATKIIHTVLYGLEKPITVNGAQYKGTMPAWKGTLSNNDVADVLIYIRSSWGNKATPVSPADVAKVPK